MHAYKNDTEVYYYQPPIQPLINGQLTEIETSCANNQPVSIRNIKTSYFLLVKLWAYFI